MDSLGKFTDKIRQPTIKLDSDTGNPIEYLQNIASWMNANGCSFLCDDGVYRDWIGFLAPNIISFNSLDLVNLMIESQVLTRAELAEIKKKLCDWNVRNVPVDPYDVFVLLEGVVGTDNTVHTIQNRLNESNDAQIVFNYIWDLNKEYPVAVDDLANLLTYALQKVDGVRVERNVLAAIWCNALFKLQLRNDIKLSRNALSGHSLIMTAKGLTDTAPTDSILSQNLWSVYRDVAQEFLRSEKDSVIEDALCKSVIRGLFHLEEHDHNITYNFLVSGLTEGTSEYSQFVEGYHEARLQNAAAAS